MTHHIKNITLGGESKRRIPKTLQGKLWSVSTAKLDFQKNKQYIIHQLLMYGSLQEIKWLFSVYSKKEIRHVFTIYPKKIYSPQAFNFVKNFILHIKGATLNENKYLKITPRVIR